MTTAAAAPAVEDLNADPIVDPNKLPIMGKATRKYMRRLQESYSRGGAAHWHVFMEVASRACDSYKSDLIKAGFERA